MGRFAVGLGLGLMSAGLAGLATDRVEFENNTDHAYNQEGVRAIGLPGNGVLFFSVEPIRPETRVETLFPSDPLAEGKEDGVLIYQSNVQIPEATRESLVSNLVEIGVDCPTNAATVSPINKSDGSEVGDTKLRICIDYGKSTMDESGVIIVPLMLEERSGVDGPLQIDERTETDKCRRWVYQYSQAVNQNIIELLRPDGAIVPLNDFYPIVIRMSAYGANPCDSDAQSIAQSGIPN